MSIQVGSFNVLNFNSGDLEEGNASQKEFKEEKAKRIANFIRNNKLDIIALQEIQTWATVERVLTHLNGNNFAGEYRGFHSDKPYEELNQHYQNKTRNSFKSEYAFIWNSRVVNLVTEPFVYKSIYDRILKSLDTFIQGALAVVAGAIIARQMMAGKSNKTAAQEKSKKTEKNDKKKTAAQMAVSAAVGATAIAAATPAITDSTVKPMLRKQVEEMLKKTLRPPLIGVFERSDSGNNVQLRIINTHIQFSKTDFDECGEVTLRKLETGFLLNNVFEIVHSQRTGDPKYVQTLIAGDFNLDVNQISSIPVTEKFCVVQSENSTVTLVNKDEVKAKREKPRYEEANNYDHFIFKEEDQNQWEQILLLKDEKLFFIGEDDEKRPISDHYPIKITYNNV